MTEINRLWAIAASGTGALMLAHGACFASPPLTRFRSPIAGAMT